jgi:hypothetical protein
VRLDIEQHEGDTKTVVAYRKIELAESDVMDIFLLLVENNDEILGRMLAAKDLLLKRDYIKKSLMVHEKIDLIARKLGLDEYNLPEV